MLICTYKRLIRAIINIRKMWIKYAYLCAKLSKLSTAKAIFLNIHIFKAFINNLFTIFSAFSTAYSQDLTTFVINYVDNFF